MRLSSKKPQSFKPIASLTPDAVPDVSMIENSDPVEPVSFHCCISRPELCTIQQINTEKDIVMALPLPEK